MNYFYKPKQEVPQKNGTRDLDLRFNLPGDFFQRNLKEIYVANKHNVRNYLNIVRNAGEAHGS